MTEVLDNLEGRKTDDEINGQVESFRKTKNIMLTEKFMLFGLFLEREPEKIPPMNYTTFLLPLLINTILISSINIHCKGGVIFMNRLSPQYLTCRRL